MGNLIKKHVEKIKFIIVGGANTVLDFALLFLFTNIGIDKIIANYFSTSIAMLFSFFANKSFTFKDTSEKKKRQFVLFIIVTLTGLWVLQPLIIWGVTSLTASYISSNEISLFIAKLIATIATLIWNYLLYSRLIFKKNKTN